MDRRSAVAIAVGGIGGAGVRWAIVEAFDRSSTAAGDWPWGVFIANVVGCAVLGIAVAVLAGRGAPVILGATVGFCGALTTFSAFAVDAALFLRADEHGRLVTYLVLSFVAGAAAFVAGGAVGRRIEDPA